MAVYAPDSGKDMELCEVCVSSVLRVLRDGRRGGATHFFKNDIEKLNDFHGLLCWQEYDHDPGGSPKNHVVQHHEGVQLQGFFCVVQ